MGCGRPRTDAGAHLLATALNRPGARGLDLDYPGRMVFSCAFELAVRRRFRSESPIAEIARTVANAARRHPFSPLDALTAEMLIRDALGEAVPIDEIPPAAIAATHMVLFAEICDELAWRDDEIDAAVAAAEERAKSRR